MQKILTVLIVSFLSLQAQADLSDFAKTFKKILQEKELTDGNGELRIHEALIRTCDIYHMDVVITTNSQQRVMTYYLEGTKGQILLKELQNLKVISELEIKEYNGNYFYAESRKPSTLQTLRCGISDRNTICEEGRESVTAPFTTHRTFAELVD